MIELTTFVMDNYPPARSWGVERVTAWLSWFSSRGLLLCVRQCGRLAAVACVRCVSDTKEAEVYYTHRESGSLLFAELVIAKSRGAFRKLWGAVLRTRFPSVRRISWERGLRGRGIREFNFGSTERLIYGRQ